MIYTLVDEAKNWLSENAQQLQEDEEQLELQVFADRNYTIIV